MSTAENYVRESIAKDIAGCVQKMDDLKGDLLKVNSEKIPDDQLGTIAEAIKKLDGNLGMSRIVTMVAVVMSGGQPE